MLSRPGEAIYNAANGMVEGNNTFQVAWSTDREREDYLTQLHQRATQEKRPLNQIVFEGNALAELKKNHLLQKAFSEPLPTHSPRNIPVWLGEPVAIRDPIAAMFRRQSGCNLLIVGQDEEAALGMMGAAIVSLAAQLPVPTKNSFGSIFILDFSIADAPHGDFFTNLSEQVSHITSIGKRKQLLSMIHRLSGEVDRRMNNEEEMAPPIFLFIYGIQRARDLRQEDSLSFSSFGEETSAPNPSQQFATILREGSDVGIHTIIWCDTTTNLYRTLDRRTLREFVMRVTFQMSTDDSVNLIETPDANKLGLHRALFYHEEEGKLEKFRPYALTTQQDIIYLMSQKTGNV